jgi:hypothetical protein
MSAFEPTSKRRRGFPSEQHVKRGQRIVHGDKELIREAGSQRPMSMPVREVVSRSAACFRVSSTDLTVITTSADQATCVLKSFKQESPTLRPGFRFSPTARNNEKAPSLSG